MKFIYSKIAIAIVCFNGAITHDLYDKGHENNIITKINQDYLGGLGFSMTQEAYASIERITICWCGGDDNDDGWDWGYDFGDYGGDYSDDGVGSGGGSSGESNNPTSDDPNTYSAETVADAVIAIVTLKNELAAIALLPNINPAFKAALQAEITKLGNIVAKGNLLASALSSGTQAAIDIAEGDFIGAVAESAAFLTGIATAAGITSLGVLVLGTSTAAVAATAIAATAVAFGAANLTESLVEGSLNYLSDEIEDAIYQSESFFDRYLDPCGFNRFGTCQMNINSQPDLIT